MGAFAGGLNALYVLAGIALFTMGEAPVVSQGVDFLGNKFAMAWAGWKFCGCFYLALVNFGVPLRVSSVIAMVPYIAFDYFACQDEAHWTLLAHLFIALEALTALAALAGDLNVGGMINVLYCLAGGVLFITEAPVITPGVDFLGDKFAMAWVRPSSPPSPLLDLSSGIPPCSRCVHACVCVCVCRACSLPRQAGWKFSGCFFFALVNLGLDVDLATFVAMVPYCALTSSPPWTARTGRRSRGVSSCSMAPPGCSVSRHTWQSPRRRRNGRQSDV